MDHLAEIKKIGRVSDKTAFHRQAFDFLLALWNNRIGELPRQHCIELIPVLRRWLKEAPTNDMLDRFRILAARPAILSVLHSAGEEVDCFLESALGPLNRLELLKPWARRKLALTASMDSLWAPDLSLWDVMDPEEAMTYAIAALFDEPVGKHGLARFNEIVDAVSGLHSTRLPERYLGNVAYASYISSFATSKGKYAVKPVFARLARNMLRERGITDDDATVEKLQTTAIPLRAVVVSEHLQPGGVMLRCYASAVASLKPHFEVILVAESPSKCAEHLEISHRQQYFEPDERKLGELVRTISELAPQLIFFPSVGMTWWTYALSLLRLAPVQVASIGHPSPIGSGCMDYLAIQDRLWVSDMTELEPFLRYESHPIAMTTYQSGWLQALREEKSARAAEGPVRVAINASSMKLNAVFMSALQRISEEHGGNVIYRFFPHGVGIRHASISARIRAWFPDAEIMPGTDYQPYMRWLAECELMLQSFPFGGTNTTLDALALGLPVVCMDGPELHSRIDAAILAQVGLAGELLVADEEDYLCLSGRLIRDASLRSRIGANTGAIAALELGKDAAGITLGQALSKAVAGEA